MNPKLQQRLKQHQLDSQAPERRLMLARQAVDGAYVNIQQKSYLNFCHNDYLGLSQHPKVVEAAQSALSEFGVGSTASQWVLGLSETHEALKHTIAEWLNQPKATLFSSTFLANLGTMQSLIKRHDTVFHDRENHASLIDAIRSTRCHQKRYSRSEKLSQLTEGLAKSNDDHLRWIITDAVFSMSGAQAPLKPLTKLAKQFKAQLIIDDAHGIGVLGQSGAGTASQQTIKPSQLTAHIIGFGKALGTMGGAVAGDASLIDHIEQNARSLAFTTAPPTCVAAATLAAIKLIKQQPEILEKLQHNIHYFVSHTQQIPQVYCENFAIVRLITKDRTLAHKCCHFLKQRGFWTHVVQPPSVAMANTGLRITLSSLHSRNHIHQLLEAIHEMQRTEMLGRWH